MVWSLDRGEGRPERHLERGGFEERAFEDRVGGGILAMVLSGDGEVPFRFPAPDPRRRAMSVVEEVIRRLFAERLQLYWVFKGIDGTQFTPETAKKKRDFGRNFYATMTFENMPAADQSRIQIAWMRGWEDYPKNMPFNQQASFPCALTLRKLPTGLTLCRNPIQEIATLRGAGGVSLTDHVLKPGANPLAELTGEIFDIRLVLDVSRSTRGELVLNLRGNEVRYVLKRRILRSHGSELR